MFTSRAEYRLSLREDNADLRLTPVGRELGLVDDERWRSFEVKQSVIRSETERLAGIVVRPQDVPADSRLGPLRRDTKAQQLLRRPECRYDDLVALPRVGAGSDAGQLNEEMYSQVAGQLEIQARYQGYIERQSRDIERQRRQQSMPLPAGMDYSRVQGLSNEVREKLARVRPASIGQASRIAGVTPAAVSLLLIHLKKREYRESA